MRKRVVITGLGCISPLGNDITTTWKRIIAGESGVGPITSYDTTSFKTKFAAEVKGFDGVELFGSKEARRMDRFTQFGLAAAQQAVIDAGLKIDDTNRYRIGVVIGSGIGGIATIVDNIIIANGIFG